MYHLLVAVLTQLSTRQPLGRLHRRVPIHFSIPVNLFDLSSYSMIRLPTTPHTLSRAMAPFQVLMCALVKLFLPTIPDSHSAPLHSLFLPLLLFDRS